MVYIVFAQAGSYPTEDTDSWIVCAYANEEPAKQHALKAQMRWRRLMRMVRMWRTRGTYEPTTWLDRWGDPRHGANPYDPGMRYNDTLWYSVVVIPLLAAVQKIEAIAEYC